MTTTTMGTTKAKYGLCGNCEHPVPRDEMCSINAKCYDQSNEENKIPIRLCPECFAKMVEVLDRMRWQNDLFSADELGLDADGQPRVP